MFSFKASTIPSSIYVVGCGGTGSRLVPMLAQFIRSITKVYNPRGWLESPKIILVDGDDVEPKNLLRQNFVKNDIGKNKAVVLAQRYGRHFEIDISAVPEFVPTRYCKEMSLYDAMKDTQADYVNQDTNTFLNKNKLIRGNVANMVIMCVDNVEARRSVIDTFSILSRGNNGIRTIFVDAGNEDSFGQVKYFTSDILSALKTPHRTIGKMRTLEVEPVEVPIGFMPFPIMDYEHMVPGIASGVSCADLDQTLAINALMATNILAIVQNYYYGKAMLYNEVSVSLDGSSFVKWNTHEDMYNRIVKSGDLPEGVIASRSKVGYETEPKGIGLDMASLANYPTLQFMLEYASIQNSFKVPKLKTGSAAKAPELKPSREEEIAAIVEPVREFLIPGTVAVTPVDEISMTFAVAESEADDSMWMPPAEMPPLGGALRPPEVRIPEHIPQLVTPIRPPVEVVEVPF